MLAALVLALTVTQGQPKPTVTTDGALTIVTLNQPQGRIHVYLPSDMAAGDTISGTVVPDPNGRNDDERNKNADVLFGTVVDINGKGVKAEEGRFTIDVPTDLQQLPISLHDYHQDAKVLPKALPDRVFTPVFWFPKVILTRKPMVITGPFDGDTSNTKVDIGNLRAPVLAETPRQAVVATPSDPTSNTNVRINEDGTITGGTIRIIQVQLSTPAQTLVRGQSTPLTIKVTGLDGLTDPIPLRVTNLTPNVITLEGGESQIKVINRGNVSAGEFVVQWKVTSKQPGRFSIGVDPTPIANIVVPEGFKQDPDDPNLVIPDGTEIKPGDKIQPRKFQPDGLVVPNPGDRGNFQEREKPYVVDLGWAKAWLQRIPSESFNKHGHIYRGGEFVVYFKHTSDDCTPGKWRQIVRGTTYVGSSTDDLKPAELKDGRMVPSGDADYKGDWAIDTNKAGRDAKNPDYPHQDKGEMIDSPQRDTYTYSGYYSGVDPFVKAMVVRKEVEFYTFWIGPDGKICKTFKWSFAVTWEFKPGDDPATEDAMSRAKVSTAFSDPTEVDKDSQEGKDAAAAYDNALAGFMK